MKVLYITEDYLYSKVHHNLVKSLVNVNNSLSCTIFTFYRESEGVKNIQQQLGEINYELVKIRNSSNTFRYKLDFSYKLALKYKALIDKVDIRSYDLVFAATTFSEGALARKLHKEYNIPYVVAVRGTDFSVYWKYMCHLWTKGREILLNSSRIFFISPNLADKTYNHIYLQRDYMSIKNKSVVIPNGIDEFWIKNQQKSTLCKTNQKKITFLFIGRLDKNKNIKNTIKAFIKVKNSFKDYNLRLKIIGEEGVYSDFVHKVTKTDSCIKYLGPIYEKESLLKCMKESDAFIMVSHSETFGLVYIEAMSQNLPVIYTRKQGIDGFFKTKKIGEKAYSKSVSSIAESMSKVIENYYKYDSIGSDLKRFTWRNIALEYLNSI